MYYTLIACNKACYRTGPITVCCFASFELNAQPTKDTNFYQSRPLTSIVMQVSISSVNTGAHNYTQGPGRTMIVNISCAHQLMRPYYPERLRFLFFLTSSTARAGQILNLIQTNLVDIDVVYIQLRRRFDHDVEIPNTSEHYQYFIVFSPVK